MGSMASIICFFAARASAQPADGSERNARASPVRSSFPLLLQGPRGCRLQRELTLLYTKISKHPSKFVHFSKMFASSRESPGSTCYQRILWSKHPVRSYKHSNFVRILWCFLFAIVWPRKKVKASITSMTSHDSSNICPIWPLQKLFLCNLGSKISFLGSENWFEWHLISTFCSSLFTCFERKFGYKTCF